MSEQSALISVYNKEGVVEFAEGLDELGWNIYSSGGTARKISEESGVPVTDVAELVGGEAILGHRVVTLSREVHAGLLADKNDPQQMSELEGLGIPLLDMVCVDMYPLEEAIANGKTEKEVIETTDVGGPTMLHSGVKGRRIVLSQANQREPVLDWLRAGKPDEEFVLRALAGAAENEVARYVANSAEFILSASRRERDDSDNPVFESESQAVYEVSTKYATMFNLTGGNYQDPKRDREKIERQIG